MIFAEKDFTEKKHEDAMLIYIENLFNGKTGG